MFNRERKDWIYTALKLAQEIAELRSEDPYLQVGCCAIKKDSDIVLGYNGFPAGFNMSMEDRDARRPYMIHAERNVLDRVKPNEIKIFAVTHLPCPECLKSIKQKGVNEIYYLHDLERKNEVNLSNKMADDFNINLYQEKL
jgi:deoxycytidylate deaminase